MDTYKTQNDERHERKTNRENQYHSNTDELEKKWNDMRNTYREHYPNLTDEDVKYRTGEFDHMTERIARRLNRRRQDIENDIRSWDRDRPH